MVVTKTYVPPPEWKPTKNTLQFSCTNKEEPVVEGNFIHDHLNQAITTGQGLDLVPNHADQDCSQCNNYIGMQCRAHGKKDVLSLQNKCCCHKVGYLLVSNHWLCYSCYAEEPIQLSIPPLLCNMHYANDDRNIQVMTPDCSCYYQIVYPEGVLHYYQSCCNCGSLLYEELITLDRVLLLLNACTTNHQGYSKDGTLLTIDKLRVMCAADK